LKESFGSGTWESHTEIHQTNMVEFRALVFAFVQKSLFQKCCVGICIVMYRNLKIEWILRSLLALEEHVVMDNYFDIKETDELVFWPLILRYAFFCGVGYSRTLRWTISHFVCRSYSKTQVSLQVTVSLKRRVVITVLPKDLSKFFSSWPWKINKTPQNQNVYYLNNSIKPESFLKS